jgi:hypothetical protein
VATSSKVQFKLDTLKAKALESIDYRIDQITEDLSWLDNEDALSRRVQEWRAAQEAKLSEVFNQLGENGISDEDLAKFRLDPIPTQDLHERNRMVKQLRSLGALRTQIVAKADSLVGDADGNISLTKTQLSEFFDL